MEHTATYSPEDNKLRLYPAHRLSPEDYSRVKAAGFSWAPRQELFVAPMWTPSRADLLIEMCGEIGDEDTSLVDRAEQRADRFSDYSEKRASDAQRASAAVEAITEHIPMGQPILIGHHSERHARKDAERIQNGMRKTVQMWETAKYWEQRAAGALAHAKYKELPGVRARRIKGIEADKRRSERSIADARKYSEAWSAEGLTRARAVAIANYDHVSKVFTLAEFPREATANQYEGMMGLYSALTGGVINETQAAEIAVRVHARTIAHNERWIAHYNNRLAYERAMLGDYAPPVKAKRTPPPLTNFNVEGAEQMTSAEWAKKHKDYKGTREEKATETHGAYRYRVAMAGNYRLARVFITDAKVTDAPKLKADAVTPGAVEVPRFQPKDNTEERLQREGELIQTQIVHEEARAAVKTRAAIPSEAELRKLREQAKAGVQVVVAPQLFPTPDELARRMAQEADIWPGQRVLEPSAGTGNILRHVIGQLGGLDCGRVVAVEINGHLVEGLREQRQRTLYGTEERFEIHHGDFLAQNGNLGTFDRIVMNPPFANAQDVAHIKHALHMLKPGGRLVAICAGGPRQERELLPLVEQSGGIWEPLPAGTFKESGTNVSTVLLTIEAPPKAHTEQ